MDAKHEFEDGPSSKRICPEIVCDIAETTLHDVEWVKKLANHGNKSGIGLQAAISRLDTDRSCKVLTDTIMLHKAFRAALKKQLSVLHDDCNLAAVLYHGAPCVGKSSLALATAYYLALAHGSSCIVKFQHHTVSRSDMYEGILKRFMSQKCVIFDQVNTNTLHPSCLTVKKQRKEDVYGCLPFTLFTSGQYPPPKCWTELSDSKHLRYRVIDMAMEEEGVKELFQHCEASEALFGHINSILKTSKSYGVLKKYVFNLDVAVRYGSMEPNDFVKILYETSEIESSQLELSKEFWILWPSFFRMSREEQKQMLNGISLKTGNFLISQEQMQYLSLKLSQVKLCEKDPLSKALDWFILVPNDSNRSCTESATTECYSGYIELEDGQYSFVFADVQLLRHVLEVGCCHFNLETALQVYFDAYKLVRGKASSTLNNVAGGLFKEYIRIFTTFHLVEGNPCGLWFNMPDVLPTQVNIQSEVSNVQEILDCIPCQEPGKCEIDHTTRIWLNLNKSGKMAFPGYDFAFLDVRHNVDGEKGNILNLLQLFQVTVSPNSKIGHKAEIMGKILVNISEELFRKDYTTKEVVNVVKPVLLVPSDVIKVSQYIKIQSEDKSKSWLVPVVSVKAQNFNL